MAGPRPTYAFIPPPPLPEFYLPKSKLPVKDDDNASTASSEVTDRQLALVKTKKKKQADSQQTPHCAISQHSDTNDFNPTHHVRTTVTRETKEEVTYRPKPLPVAAPLVVVPAEQMPGRASDVPPLAVYHICRVCLRPRSSRYHRANPIPINGLPPPPGICRRCRVTPAEEKEAKKVDVVLDERSNEVKLGLRCFVPEEDYVTNDEGRERRGRAIMRSLSHRRDREIVDQNDPSKTGIERESTKMGVGREIVYRHVKVRETSLSTSPAPLPRPKTGSTTTAQDAIDAAKQKLRRPPPPAAVPPARELTTKPTTVKAPGESNPWTTVARIEVEAPASAYDRLSQAIESLAEKASKHERSESEIRRIAREEVEKYRQAERLMAAHPNAYARRRLVPVERRIAIESDVREVPPWQVQKGLEEVRVTRERECVDPLPQSPPPMREERTFYGDSEVVKYAESSHDKSDHHVDRSTSHTHSAHRERSAPSGGARSRPRAGPSAHDHEVQPWGPRWLHEPERPVIAASVKSDKTQWPAEQKSERSSSSAVRQDQDKAPRLLMRSSSVQDVEIMQSLPSTRPRNVLVESEPKHSRRGSQIPSVGGSWNPWDALSEMQTGNKDYTQRQRSKQAPSQAEHPSVASTKEKSDNSRSEYVYTVRTTEPVRKRSERDTREGNKRYYSITREHIRRLNETTGNAAGSQQGHKSPEEVKVGTSEYGSSRVRFATKVEISPAAPGSDASSSQFRQFGPGGRGGLAYDADGVKSGPGQLGRGDERSPDHEVAHDEGRRGRAMARDREKEKGQPYFQEAKVTEHRKYERQWDEGAEETLRRRAESGDSVPMNRGCLPGALSESPSRERVEEMIKRPNSTDVEDGSNAPRHWAGNGGRGRHADAGGRSSRC